MAKNTIKALEEFILLIDKNEVGVDDVLYGFWDDTEALEDKEFEIGILIKSNCEERQKMRKRSQKAERERLLAELNTLVKERERLRGMVERRRQTVRVAFNQLFLAGKAKQVYVRSYDGEKVCETFVERLEQAQNRYPESYRQTEILKRSEMEPWLKSVYKPKGELICVGSELALCVWPERISKVNHNQAKQLSLF